MHLTSRCPLFRRNSPVREEVSGENHALGPARPLSLGVSTQDMHALLKALTDRSWIVEPMLGPSLMPSSITERYPMLEGGVLEVLSQFSRCSRPDEQSWLLALSDFQAVSSQGFRWNEYEIMALESAANQQERDSITRFWDEHFPFLLAVQADYDYLAIRLSDGSVMHGSAPEWELPSVLAPSFEAFVEYVSTAVQVPYPLSVVL